MTETPGYDTMGTRKKLKNMIYFKEISQIYDLSYKRLALFFALFDIQLQEENGTFRSYDLSGKPFGKLLVNRMENGIRDIQISMHPDFKFGYKTGIVGTNFENYDDLKIENALSFDLFQGGHPISGELKIETGVAPRDQIKRIDLELKEKTNSVDKNNRERRVLFHTDEHSFSLKSMAQSPDVLRERRAVSASVGEEYSIHQFKRAQIGAEIETKEGKTTLKTDRDGFIRLQTFTQHTEALTHHFITTDAFLPTFFEIGDRIGSHLVGFEESLKGQELLYAKYYNLMSESLKMRELLGEILERPLEMEGIDGE